MSSPNVKFGPEAFKPVHIERAVQTISRPSLSYWQDAMRRLRLNPRAMASFVILIAMGLFTIAGPWVWRVGPNVQDVDQISQPPTIGTSGATALITEPRMPWPGVTTTAPAVDGVRPLSAVTNLRLFEPATTQGVRLVWDPLPGAAGYVVYRNIYDPSSVRALGLPIGETIGVEQVRYEDRLDLTPVRYWYSVVALDENGAESGAHTTLAVDTVRAVSAGEALARGWVEAETTLTPGETIRLPDHPLGTDYLGRDILARLMSGARVSLFIGVVAPVLFMLVGIVYGSAAGFIGGRADPLLMRIADFVMALPFLLFMILLKIAFGIGPGESGIFPMLVALMLLSWPSPARLVRGQILQIREEGYIGASRLLGARTGYLVFRHMIPNTMGVILVAITFAIPSVIFTEAFLSFIGMGVSPPTASWGSMCNEGIRTMLSHPHEIIFPALFISVTVLAFNLFGDGLRDALDVRMRGRE